MKTILATLFTLFIFLSRPAAADAQTTSSAPDVEQDFIVPARPTFSNPAEFQRPGVLQLEYGYNANFHAPGVSVAQDTPLALRFAANSRFLLELDSDLVISQSAPGGIKATGFGDMQVGVQGVLEHEKESRPGIAVAYYIKLPTASSSKGLGTGRVDHNFVALVSKKFGQTVLDFNAIYLLAGSAIDRGRASSAQGAIALSHNLNRRTGVQGEISGFSRNDLQPGAVFGLGVVTYQINRRLVVDGGARFGLTHDAPRAGIVAGLTVGVSDLYRKNKK
jgi:Putative MetA-pathway of phenol degradation